MKARKDASSDIALKVEHVSKSFRLPTEKANGIKQAFINRVRGVKGYSEQHVLDDISFEVKKGDFFGIVGRNGSGKSTLLKLISQIYTPDNGKITVNGSLVPFIELGVGFNPELTGRENVYMNGALLGFSESEIDVMYDEIVDFAELHKFMDQKLKNYSSGMQVRLAFSIAVKARADILVLDEVLAVGDEAFQRKCFQYFAQLKRENKTVILVTHSMESVQQFCNKVALVDRDQPLIVGSPLEIAQIYRELNSETDAVGHGVGATSSSDFFSVTPSFVMTGERLVFDFTLEPLQDIDDDLVVTFVIHKDDGEMLYRFTSDEKIRQSIDFHIKNNFHISLENIFPDGSFSVQIGVKKRDRSKNYALFDDILRFELSNGLGNEFWRPNEEYSLEEVR